jgi:hypothetical protein
MYHARRHDDRAQRRNVSMQSSIQWVRTGALAVMLACNLSSRSAAIVTVCGTSDSIDLSNVRILPFGGEFIGVAPGGAEIVGVDVNVQFTATGAFNAADVAVAFEIIAAQGGGGAYFSGSAVGWSGQGTFTTSFSTSDLNGLLYNDGQQFSSMIITFFNLNPGNGPITGNFDSLVYTIHYGRCPLGDITHDLNVDVNDLLAVVGTWGACPAPPQACPADTDASGAVDVNDLLTVVSHWGQWCPDCS